ncbi:MAG: amidase [Acidibacillus sp.]|nr:amidase [Acidibacillus sp.]
MMAEKDLVSELTHLTATEMIKGLEQKLFSSVELVQAHVTRMETVNPKLNAVAYERYELALKEAETSDQERLSRSYCTDTPRLQGMPITVKEMYSVQGLPITGGVHKHRNRMAEEDAAVVSRVKAAGAIILAKTNMSTLTMAHETDNVLFGRTNHPLDPLRTPGGSSGGEAALISSFASPWGIGSDLGGSIRLPAHLCGLVGIRPTYDRISSAGEYPAYHHHLHMNSAGVLARNVEDVQLLYEVLSDHVIMNYDMEDTPIKWLSSSEKAPLDEELENGMLRLADILRDASVQIEEVDGNLLSGSTALWQNIILEDRGKETIDEIQEGPTFHLFSELLKSGRGKSVYHKWILRLLLGARLFPPSEQTIQSIPRQIEEMRSRFHDVIGNHGILIMPTYPTAAPFHGKITQYVYNNMGSRVLPYLVFVNVLGYPSMSVPIGRTKMGLPFGIQVVGGYRQEQRVFAVAKYIESVARYV